MPPDSAMSASDTNSWLVVVAEAKPAVSPLIAVAAERALIAVGDDRSPVVESRTKTTICHSRCVGHSVNGLGFAISVSSIGKHANVMYIPPML